MLHASRIVSSVRSIGSSDAGSRGTRARLERLHQRRRRSGRARGRRPATSSTYRPTLPQRRAASRSRRSSARHSAPAVEDRGTARAPGRAARRTAGRRWPTSDADVVGDQRRSCRRSGSTITSVVESVGPALGEQVDLGRRPGTPDREHHGGEQDRRRQHRQRDVGEPPPPAGAVDEWRSRTAPRGCSAAPPSSR